MSVELDHATRNRAESTNGIEDGAPGSAEALELLLISSFNVANLAALLSKDQEEPKIHATAAPYGQVMQLLLSPAADTWERPFNGVVIWTSPESVCESYGRLLAGEIAEPDQLRSEVDDFCRAIKSIPGHVAIRVRADVDRRPV